MFHNVVVVCHSCVFRFECPIVVVMFRASSTFLLLLFIPACWPFSNKKMCPGGPAYPVEACEVARPAPRQLAVRVALTAVADEPAGGASRRCTLTFENVSSMAQTIQYYELSWPGGRKVVTDDRFRLAPGTAMTRTLIFAPTDGSFDTLTIGATEVLVELQAPVPGSQHR